MARAPSKSAPVADPFVDFPDDSGATEHVVEPVLCDAYEAFLDDFLRLIAAPWPLVPEYA